MEASKTVVFIIDYTKLLLPNNVLIAQLMTERMLTVKGLLDAREGPTRYATLPATCLKGSMS